MLHCPNYAMRTVKNNLCCTLLGKTFWQLSGMCDGYLRNRKKKIIPQQNMIITNKFGRMCIINYVIIEALRLLKSD